MKNLITRLLLIISILFIFVSANSVKNEETADFYYYASFVERSGSGSFTPANGYAKGYRPVAYYTIVKSYCGDGNYSTNETAIANAFRVYLDAKFNDLPYGDEGARIFKSRKEAEETRLEFMNLTKKYVNYKISELEYFNYYCD
ncbi:hypothetical protein [Aequorivita nionensis]|uniref:hypothetical protein n=1 Tax=Aequorivita nionensis TaxID=1287690 RepID=UPI003965A9D2